MKGQNGPSRRMLLASLLALIFSLTGCKLEDALLPTGDLGPDAVAGDGTIAANVNSAFGVTAPIIADPLSGSTVSDPQPSLTVLNSAHEGGAEPTYLYQVSTDPSFVTLIAQSSQIVENTSGSTTWTVNRALPDGAYSWRVRARSGVTESAFSATAQFNVSGGGVSGPPPSSPTPSPNPPPPGPTPTGTIVADPLSGGSTGEVHGGSFTNGGWLVNAPDNFIRYEVPPMARGWVEFDTSGLRPENPAHNQFMLFGMWDPTAGPFRSNPFRVNIQKLHPNPHNPPYLRVRWIANGEQRDDGTNFFDWNPSRTYRWRLEWGPDGSSNRARLFLDGALIIEIAYSRAYRPNVHFIELGIGERGESIVGVRYSNLVIGN